MFHSWTLGIMNILSMYKNIIVLTICQNVHFTSFAMVGLPGLIFTSKWTEFRFLIICSYIICLTYSPHHQLDR